MRAPLYTSLDDALDEIAPYGIELKNGNSNHAPMVAEALCALGRPEAVMPWVARYRERMQPRPAAGDRDRPRRLAHGARAARALRRLGRVFWRGIGRGVVARRCSIAGWRGSPPGIARRRRMA